MHIDTARFTELFGGALGDLDADGCALLVGSLQERRFADGETLTIAGEPADSLFLLVEGDVDVVSPESIGGESVGHFGAGDLVGEVGFLSPGPATATVRARGDVATFSIAHSQLDELWAAHPEVASDVLQALLMTMSRRIRAIEGDLDRGPDARSDGNVLRRLLHRLSGRAA